MLISKNSVISELRTVKDPMNTPTCEFIKIMKLHSQKKVKKIKSPYYINLSREHYQGFLNIDESIKWSTK